MKHVFFLLILCTCTLLGITACSDDLPNELIEIQLNKEDKFWRPKIVMRLKQLMGNLFGIKVQSKVS